MKLKSFIAITIFFLCLFLFQATSLAYDLTLYPAEGQKLSLPVEIFHIKIYSNELFANNPKVRVWLNGTEIPKNQILNMGFLLVDASQAARLGENSAKLSVALPDGSNFEKAWKFELFPPPTSKLLTHDADASLVDGEVLRISCKAEPNAKIQLFLPKIFSSLPMHEFSSGHYEARYRVRTGDFVENAILTAVITMPNGKIQRISAEKRISVDAKFFTVKILEPKNFSQTDIYCTIKGKTRPNSVVMITPSNSIIGMPSSKTGVPGAVTVDADEDGFFSLRYGFPIKVPLIKMQYKFYISAVDSENNRSLTTVLTVYVKK